MKTFRWCFVLILCSIFYVGSSRNIYSNVNTSFGQVYVGMSGDQITKIMGPPQSVGQGKYGCHYIGHFFGLEPGNRSVEWAWKDNGGILVAYLDNGIVSYLGVVPNDQIK